MDGGFFRLGQVGGIEQVTTQHVPVRRQGGVTGLAALDEHTHHVEDLAEQLVGGTTGADRERAWLLEELLGDAITIPIDTRAVRRGRLAFGKIAEGQGMHDMRKRVEAETDGVTWVADGGRGGVAGDTSRGVGARREGIE